MTESGNYPQAELQGDEVALRDLVEIVWRGKWIIGAITVATAIMAGAMALTLPDVYRAEALVAINEESSSGDLSRLLGQYGGIAGLAGINLGAGSPDKGAMGLEILKSRKFIVDFIERRDLLVPLLAATGWDATSGQLVLDADLYDSSSGVWTRKVSPPRKSVPSSQEAYDEFKGIFAVSQDLATGFVTIEMEHLSPTVAKQWVTWLIEDINSTIMENDVAKASRAISYLNEQIDNTSVSSLQSIFYSLIEEQLKIIMLANMSDEYFLKTLDPPVAPERKSKPRRALIVIFAALLGFFASATAVLIAASMRREVGQAG